MEETITLMAQAFRKHVEEMGFSIGCLFITDAGFVCTVEKQNIKVEISKTWEEIEDDGNVL